MFPSFGGKQLTKNKKNLMKFLRMGIHFTRLIVNLTEEAVKEAELAVSGRDVTPYILQRVHEITGGQSLKASILL